ncbi:SRPBCC family protein [Halobaculum sp. MBLA0143]|uniref:SRPBCC family protein n=1 Tax=Halobaculum sp. MBLA0143 TaxID=3079933 RepID=UPI003526AD5B
MSVTAAVEIDAPPAAVWEALTAFERYGAWNPLLPRVEGEPVEGESVRAVIAQPRFPPVPIRAEITRVDPERELAWEAAVPGGGLVRVSHAFQLRPLAGGDRTEFTQLERLDGPVGAAVPSSLVGFLADGFDEMNEALTRRVESGAYADGVPDHADHNR